MKRNNKYQGEHKLESELVIFSDLANTTTQNESNFFFNFANQIEILQPLSFITAISYYYYYCFFFIHKILFLTIVSSFSKTAQLALARSQDAVSSGKSLSNFNIGQGIEPRNPNHYVRSQIFFLNKKKRKLAIELHLQDKRFKKKKKLVQQSIKKVIAEKNYATREKKIVMQIKATTQNVY